VTILELLMLTYELELELTIFVEEDLSKYESRTQLKSPPTMRYVSEISGIWSNFFLNSGLSKFGP